MTELEHNRRILDRMEQDRYTDINGARWGSFGKGYDVSGTSKV